MVRGCVMSVTKKKVNRIFYEFRIVIRLVLECGHLYTRDLTGKEGIKKEYICHACINKISRQNKSKSL